jgi:cobalt/nickel transport system permease protein
MHVSDGFLDAKTAVATGTLAAIGLGVALRQTRTQLPPRRIPLLGLAAAFVFAAQMLNFPVMGGTSGHLIGGVLVAVLLGPSAATVVLASVLIVQCFIFADGGISALGANIFNMAIVSPISGYGIYRLVRRMVTGQRGLILGAAFAGWCATVLAAVSCAGQLALAGVVSWTTVFPAMANIHILIGIGEGLMTGLIVVAIARVRPELVEDTNKPWPVGFGLLMALGLALFVAPVACPWPDGLEKVAAQLGFEHRAATPLLHSPLAEYRLPGIGSPMAATALAGVIGTVIAFGLAWVLARLLAPKMEGEAPAEPWDSGSPGGSPSKG